VRLVDFQIFLLPLTPPHFVTIPNLDILDSPGPAKLITTQSTRYKCWASAPIGCKFRARPHSGITGTVRNGVWSICGPCSNIWSQPLGLLCYSRRPLGPSHLMYHSGTTSVIRDGLWGRHIGYSLYFSTLVFIPRSQSTYCEKSKDLCI